MGGSGVTGNYQISAILANGARVLFGVPAQDEAAALAAARHQLSWFPVTAEQVTVILLPGRRRPGW